MAEVGCEKGDAMHEEGQRVGQRGQQPLYEEIRNNVASGRSDEPIAVMAIKYQFFVTPSKTFSFVSRCQLLKEFQI
jgi:hypothetical protein